MELQDVLLVEDEPMIRTMAEEALGEAGYAVCAAVDGDEAVQLLDAAGQRFVGIVTDIRMPGSKSGWDVARHARELRQDIAVIYISGDGEPDWAALGVPNSVFISKPFAHGQVISALSTLLNTAG
jgi:CheY-like chemotaxis protein